MLRKLKPVLFELLRCVDGAENVAKQLVRSLDFSSYLIDPLLGNMAIRAYGANARSILVVDGLLQFLINIIAHLMA